MDKRNDTHSNVSDRELLRRLSKKDSTALACLYDRYDSMFKSWVYKRIRDKDEMEDVIQLYWIDLWKNASSIEMKKEESDSALPLLLKRLSLRTIDHLRLLSKKNERQISLDDNDVEQQEITNTYTHVFEDLEISETRVIFNHVVDELPKTSRKIFKMRWEQGYSFNKIAKEVDMKTENVKKKYKKAKIFVVDRMRETYHEPNNKKSVRLAALLMGFFIKFFS